MSPSFASIHQIITIDSSSSIEYESCMNRVCIVYASCMNRSKSIPWCISAKEHSYFCGGVNHEEDAAKDKRRRRKRNSKQFPSPSIFFRRVLFVVYAPAEVIIFLSADFHGIDLERFIHDAYTMHTRCIHDSYTIHTRWMMTSRW